MSTNEIENILRRAPQPKPPGNLKQSLKARVPIIFGPVVKQAVSSNGPSSWLARWWAALAPAVVSLACAAGLTVQRIEINDLKARLEQATDTSSSPDSNASKGGRPASDGSGTGTVAVSEQSEVARLRDAAASLAAEVAKLEQMKTENEMLRGRLAAASKGVFSPQEMEALDHAREQATQLRCLNNLKQLGLAVRLWSLENHEMTPPNLVCLSNQIGSFEILICPADTVHQAAKDPSSFSAANCSYEFLAPSSYNSEPNRIFFRCPIHGSLGISDGSVQSRVGTDHPDWIVQQDGKYFLKVTESSVDEGAVTPPPANPQQ